MSIKKWLASLVVSVFMVTAVFANDDDDKVFSLPFYSVLCPYPILKNLPKCDAFIKLSEHSHLVNSVVFSPNGQWLASGSDDNTVKIWNPNTGEQLRTLEGHDTDVTTVAFSPDGQLLASGSDDNTVKIWDPNNGELWRTLEGHGGDVKSVTFSPDGQLLASGSDDDTIKIWNLNTKELRAHSKVIEAGLNQWRLVQMVNCLLPAQMIIRLKFGTHIPEST